MDYGCGVGGFILGLAERYPDSQFVGMDISQMNIDALNHEAEVRGFKNVQGLCRDLPMGSDRFDVVICLETLEHMREQPGEVTDALESLWKPGGLVIVSFPA